MKRLIADLAYWMSDGFERLGMRAEGKPVLPPIRRQVPAPGLVGVSYQQHYVTNGHDINLGA